MDPSFWHERWEGGRIAFHEAKANALLVTHFQALSLDVGARVFVPLCGKTRDIAWLLSQGCRVAGAELSALAIDQLFEELGLTPKVTPSGEVLHYHAPGLDIFVGDVFAVTADMLGPVDAVFDRAAYVALPEEMRGRYAAHVAQITGAAPQLLITFDYDQSEMEGPPFSIPRAELDRSYTGTHSLAHLDGVPVAGGLKGQCAAIENIWHLRPA